MAVCDASMSNSVMLSDMDLIEVLWKQDVDLGFTLVDPDPAKQSSSTLQKEKPSSADEIEKLKALEAINATKNEADLKEKEETEDDPWAGLSYTVDLETGEYILTTGSTSGSGQSCSNGTTDSSCEQLIRPPLDGNNERLGLADDSLGLDDDFGLEDDFPSELLSDTLLGGPGVEGLLGNDSLGLPDGFNLEEALQLVGLNEVQPQDIKSETKKKKDCAHSGEDSKDEATSSGCEDTENDDMIHTPQFHHPPHPHHRSFQSRMPYMRSMGIDQRWPDVVDLGPTILSIQDTRDPFVHPSHGYTSHGINHHGHYDTQRNVLLHNATLAPPVGDMNSTGPYHNVGGPSHLGSAVATSMNLTNSIETLGSENASAYKSEPSDMMYYHTPPSDTINQTADGLLSSLLNDDFPLIDSELNTDMYTMRLLDNSSNNASGPTGAAALPGVPTNTPGATHLHGPTDERMDASSDSAVSSMGSERVPSLSDGEWMETGSNSSHTQADSHYSMDYAGKYRMNYECSYSVNGRNGGSARCQTERHQLPPVAQKKHQMFGKRYFQEHGTGSPLRPTTLPTSPIKYEYDAQAVGAGAPGNAYAGPIEGAAGPQPELKYNCGTDFPRHHTIGHLPGRTALEHVHHNHTYHLPPDSSGTMQRPLSRDKRARKNDGSEHLSRDEKQARRENVPISVHDIINLPMDEFNERLSKYDLSESQLTLIRDIRRRGKNKVAAQNCRKRKLDQITSLADQVKEMRDRKSKLIRDRDYLEHKVQCVRTKFRLLYDHVLASLRGPDGNQCSPYEYTLQQLADGNVLFVPRNQTNPHHSRQPHQMDPKTKPDPDLTE